VAAVVVAAVADAGFCRRCIAAMAEVPEDRAGNIIADLQRSITISETSGRCEKCGDSTVTYKLGVVPARLLVRYWPSSPRIVPSV
jgi:hypothetical protein